ncbi:hypothetical protein [Kitasatospora sp. CB02891]|uniref:hypothetical protein n=1 Tax=Kitasatospora sp. CB02891 TaxID=2020329 RepID=UPI0012FD81D8|nr:hypothetical protein [Kitasatospora sp. CB02891]
MSAEPDRVLVPRAACWVIISGRGRIRSRRPAVTAENVNAAWTGTVAPEPTRTDEVSR